MQFARINGITIHFRVDGPENASSLVFINSLGTDFRIWDDVVEHLSGSWRCVRYDKRGHGLSDSPPAPYSMNDHVDDLDALLDHLEIRVTIPVGISVGGLITLGLAARYPQRLRAAIICDSMHKIGTHAMWQDRIDAIEQRGIDAISDGILQRWFSPHYRQVNPVAFNAWRNMLVRTPVDGYNGTCAAIRDADFTEAASSLSVPSLLVAGSLDGSTPPDMVRSTHELIAGSRYEIIDGSGHLPCIDNPEILTGLFRSFLEQNNLR
jgi:3-oxoadipate enol-lactonase